MLSFEEFDLNLLKVLRALYKHRNVTAAAHELRLSQGAASNALARMRRHLGDPLFVKTAEGMSPTPYAERLCEAVEQALAKVALASQSPSFDAATANRTFNLMMTDIGEQTFLPPLIERLRREAPGVSLRCAQLDIQETRDALRNGRMDLAVGFLPDLDAGFYQQKLFSQRYVCMVSSRHPRINGSLTKQAFLDEPHITVLPSGTGHRIVQESLDELGLARRSVLELQHFLAVPLIVRTTDLIVTVPELVARTFCDLVDVEVHPCPVELPTFEVKQHWHERYHHDPANQWLRRKLAEAGAALARN